VDEAVHELVDYLLFVDEAPIPGRSLVGIELPNRTPEFVTFRHMIDSDEMKAVKSKLAVILGLDVSGKPIVTDIARMPHVLVQSQTGSEKVFVSTPFYHHFYSGLRRLS
jgi:DNA segregation ATPase FtsK/SpoIIIE-like protein